MALLRAMVRCGLGDRAHHIRIGKGNTFIYENAAPIDVLSNVKRIAAGYYHGMALTQGGELWYLGYSYCNATNETNE